MLAFATTRRMSRADTGLAMKPMVGGRAAVRTSSRRPTGRRWRLTRGQSITRRARSWGPRPGPTAELSLKVGANSAMPPSAISDTKMWRSLIMQDWTKLQFDNLVVGPGRRARSGVHRWASLPAADSGMLDPRDDRALSFGLPATWPVMMRSCPDPKGDAARM